ncbi:MAG: transcription termination/antitermination factor NusG [Ruminococcaceae bacterium]|nr:transcription termination/antitermination factor NusG [Oscillospiraceae bacterium]
MSDLYDATGEKRWYVAHTYSGYENKVKTNLEKIVENRGLQDVIVDIRIPVETVEMVSDNGTKKQVEEKIYPSYVLVKMVMTDETWHVVRNISGVTGFVGPGSKPTALTDAEVASMGIEAAAPKVVVNYSIGDTVEIIDGALKGMRGTLSEISDDKKKVTVIANMFGRDTPFELDSDAITLANE